MTIMGVELPPRYDKKFAFVSLPISLIKVDDIKLMAKKKNNETPSVLVWPNT